MSSHESKRYATVDGLPVAPSLGPALEAAHAEHQSASVTLRTVWLCLTAAALGCAAALVAQALTHLIALITNLSFFGRLSFEEASPADNSLGFWVIGIPVLGALIVGIMARYGSKAIRGHGIPEAMEQVLSNKSRIPARMTFLKPVSAAIAIGTGGPFGAEGPIIATGGALGSLIGQWLPVRADERKILLASGAAAGMAATFGSPVSAVLLAVELLLFEYKPRSVLPVALAASAATALRIAFVGRAPAFEMPPVELPGGGALAFYVMLGCVIGLASVLVTRAVYFIEDAFEKLPIHWMWWPAVGAIAVGIVGFFAPRTLGVGYTNIEDIISGRLVGTALLLLCILKFVSWSIALGSGTSGGTLAPLFTIGGALGALIGAATASFVPELGVDARIAGLVGMAAIFAGASRALLASIVFAFEMTRQPLGLLPLLAGCSTSYLVSALCMRNSIMTEKLVRRGVRVLTEYGSDFLASVPVMDAATKEVRTLRITQTVKEARTWTETGSMAHQGFPVVSETGALMGVLTRRDLRSARDDTQLGTLIMRGPVCVYEDQTLREAEDAMVRQNVGRLPVVKRDEPTCVVGIVTRSDLLRAHAKRLAEG